MNCKEHHLPELELSTGQVREALQCILHTILFIRAPGAVTPRDVDCEGFSLTYTRIAGSNDHPTSRQNGQQQQNQQRNPHIRNHNSATNNSINSHDVDIKVDDAIESFLRTLSQIGPELLSGCLTLSFFERRTTNQLFGLVSHEERVVWEQWILRVVVNNTPRPINNDSASVIERQRIQDTAEGMLRAVLFKIFDIVGGTMNHIPPVQYDFEIISSSTTRRLDERENVISRVTNMPPILNLGN